MKKILCYGDSNVYGFVPKTGNRYKKEERWSGILTEILAPHYEILEEGMNNRTGFFKNPEGIKQSGGEYLPIYLQNHKNLDVCILALGTNDAQIFYQLDKEIVCRGLLNLINALKNVNPQIKIIIIPPVRIQENITNGIFSMLFDKDSVTKIQNVFSIFKTIADNCNCLYFDINEIAKPSEADGLHFSKESHRTIAQNLANFIENNL